MKTVRHKHTVREGERKEKREGNGVVHMYRIGVPQAIKNYIPQ